MDTNTYTPAPHDEVWVDGHYPARVQVVSVAHEVAKISLPLDSDLYVVPFRRLTPRA